MLFSVASCTEEHKDAPRRPPAKGASYELQNFATSDGQNLRLYERQKILTP